MSSLMKMSPRLRIRRPPVVRRSRKISRAVQIIAHGLVDTGSEWDGWHIRDVYKVIRPQCSNAATAYDLVRAIWENRAAAYQEGKIDYEAAIRAEEPWADELRQSFFEDEVIT